MKEKLEPPTRIGPGATSAAEPCNHRGHAREFARDESGRVRMTCSACGEEVKPAAWRDIAA